MAAQAAGVRAAGCTFLQRWFPPASVSLHGIPSLQAIAGQAACPVAQCGVLVVCYGMACSAQDIRARAASDLTVLPWAVVKGARPQLLWEVLPQRVPRQTVVQLQVVGRQVAQLQAAQWWVA